MRWLDAERLVPWGIQCPGCTGITLEIMGIVVRGVPTGGQIAIGPLSKPGRAPKERSLADLDQGEEWFAEDHEVVLTLLCGECGDITEVILTEGDRRISLRQRIDVPSH